MTLVTKNKDIYERILNGDLNFSEGEIQLEVLVELVALQQLKNLKNINYKAFDKNAISEMILKYDIMINVIQEEIFEDRDIMIEVLRVSEKFYNIVGDKLKDNFDFIFEVYKENQNILSVIDFEKITSEQVLLLLNENFNDNKKLIEKLSKEETKVAIDLLIKSKSKEKYFSNISFEDASLEQARKLVSLNFYNFHKINNEYKSDLNVICNGLYKNQQQQNWIEKIEEFKELFLSNFIEGLLRNKFSVEMFLENFEGNFTKEIWGAMLCDEKFLLRLEKLNIDPYVIDKDYDKYIRETILKEKIIVVEEKNVNIKVKRKI